jgi:hypothetical protein
MDELDRMYRRLVHNIRAGFPDLLTRPFEVAAVHQHLIPYRLNRRELGLDTAEEYEMNLTRLLSGARGLLIVDPEMQSALRAELEAPNPDLSAFRAFATAQVSLAPDALRMLESRPSPAANPAASQMAQRDTSRVEFAARATEEMRASGAPPAPVPPEPVPAPVIGSTGMQSPHGNCRFCDGELPDGRDVHFCPHCGQNLTVKQCPACSTELEAEWQFCISCGRQVE